MIERGRAIPNTQTVPIVGTEKPQRAQDAPQIIDGRVSIIVFFQMPFHLSSIQK